MRTIRLYLYSSSLVALLTGCATGIRVSQPDQLPVDTAFLSDMEIDYLPGDRHQSEPISDTLTLEQALEMTFQSNPRLQASGWDVRAHEANTVQARLFPNPDVGWEIEDFGGTGARAGTAVSERNLSISQLLQLGGDRRALTQIASASLSLSVWDLEAARLDLYLETSLAFTALIAAQDRLSVILEQSDLAQQFERTVQERVDAGKVSALEAARAAVVRSRAEIAARQSHTQLQAARYQLASLWGAEAPAFERAEGVLSHPERVPVIDDEIGLLGMNPALARWEAEYALQQARSDLLRAELIPDPVIQIGTKRFNEDSGRALVAGVVIPIPVFDRKQGARQQAEYNLRRIEAQTRDVRLRLLAELETIYQELLSAHAEVGLLTSEVLPAARSNYESVQTGYTEGKFDLLRVLDAQQVLFETEIQNINALEAYQSARLRLERLTTTPIDDGSGR